MKLMIASDIHGSLKFCRELVEKYKEEKDARMYLTYITGLVLKIGMDLLGIQMPDKM